MKLTNPSSAAFISRYRRGLLTLAIVTTAATKAMAADSPTENFINDNTSLLKVDTGTWSGSGGTPPAQGVTGLISEGKAANPLGWNSNTNPGSSTIGDLDFVSGATNLVVGDYTTKSSSVSVNITLAGSTLNSQANTILANSSGNTIVFENDVAPSGDLLTETGTTTFTLGHTTNVIQSKAGSNIIIDNVITGTNDALTYLGGGKAGTTGATLELGAGSANDVTGGVAANAPVKANGGSFTSTAMVQSSDKNTFTGGLTIGDVGGTANAGVVKVDGANALPTTGTVTVNTNSQLLLNGNATYGGTAQSLALNGTGTASTNGALTTTSGNVSTWQGTINVASTSSINVQGATGSLTASGIISGTGQLQSTGAGTLILTGNNSYQGGTAVTAGKLAVNNTAGSGTGTGAVTVSNTSTVLTGSGKISGGVTLNAGTSLISGGKQTGPGVTGTGLTLGSTLAVNSANLTFALGTGGNTNGATPFSFDTPNENSTFLNATGTTMGEISFTGTDSISLVDLTGGSLTLRQGTPFLLVSAGSDSYYSGLVTASGFGVNTVLSLDGNGYVVGVYNGTGPLTNFTPITINQYAADGTTPLATNKIYPDPVLYLDNGNLEVVPEPGTYALVVGGLVMLIAIHRIRRRNDLP